jgi:tetratricopeptide (TPR) repeat protein
MVIDPNPTSRSILVSQLRDFGVGDVVQCSKIGDARKHLELKSFDLVLCEHEFNEGGYSGQNLLDDLRRNQMLPLSTVFIMVTGAATYSVVAEAAESALDSYLLKPFTASALGERIQQARARKRALADIFGAIEEGDFDEAARLCLKRFAARQQYWLYAARIGSELLLRQGSHDAARKLYESVLETGALPWAKLGIARAQIESNQPKQAIRTLESLIGEHPSYVDAYDVMGRVQVEQGDFAQALVTYRQATQMTPGSLTRLQKLGMLAFYSGEREEAAKMLDRAASLGISSKMFDYQSLVILAFCRFQQKDTKGLQRCEDNLKHASEKAAGSHRLRRFYDVVKVLNLLLLRQVAPAASAAKGIGAELRHADFDIEASCNAVALLAHMSASELKLEEAPGWIDGLGMRYASSKSLTELLARSAAVYPAYAEQIRVCHQKVSELAEESVTYGLRGYHRKAVEMLLQHGEETLNPKLIDMARLTLQRHGDKIEDVDELSLRSEHLRKVYCNGPLLPSMGSTVRQAGAITIREGRPASAEPRLPSSLGDISALMRKATAELPGAAAGSPNPL